MAGDGTEAPTDPTTVTIGIANVQGPSPFVSMLVDDVLVDVR